MSKAEKLFVVEVIPIVRGLPKATLSYFTKEKLVLGSFVRITVRNTPALGLVVRTTDAKEAKSSLKASNFALKKLTPLQGDHSLSPAFIRAAEASARYYATSVGSILGSTIPRSLLESPELVACGQRKESKIKLTREPLLVQLSDEERYREYKSIVRGAFARSSSVLFLVPTLEDGLRAYDILSKGIEAYAFTTARKSAKALRSTLEAAHGEKHPILLITTPGFISFDRPDLDTIILEKENSRSYKTLARPYIDLRIFAELLAEESGKTLILGDSVLSLRSLLREKQGKYAELSPLKWKTHYDAKTHIVDMKAPVNADAKGEPEFTILSKEIIGMISRAIEEKRKVFLFAARRGLAPSTVCRDCGTVLPCDNCKAPLVLHERSNGDRFYLCHACGAQRDAHTRCGHCNSWNLVPLGIGVTRIRDEVRKLFPHSPLFILDKEHAGTAKEATAVAKEFAGDKGGILVGTELALLYLEKVPYIGIISLDSLFSIPDFGIHERVFYLVNRILEKAEREAIIQTRNIGKEVLAFASRGDILDFFRTEIQEREELAYPPFTLFIKVTTEGSSDELAKKAARLRTLFEEFSPDFIKERGVKSGKVGLSMVLRFHKNEWPKPEVEEKLALLPPDFLIKVDPDSLF
ncbi:MAG: hypothetical protein JWN89_203 [Parcubacteria group bacterium]|nr:hypothetical protein [Parcubacteria group bacterium]